METLSVIIPNYNKAQYLAECVNSILAQSFQPNEIIIVDDCSTDTSRDVILKLSRENPIVKYIFLEKNYGVSVARNKGIDLASSQYITCIDSDDYYYDVNKLKAEMGMLEQLNECGVVAVVYSSVVKVDNQDRVLLKYDLNPFLYIKGNVHEKLVALNRKETIPRDYCVSKEAIKTCGAYNYPHNFYEDLDLLMRLSKRYPFYWSGVYGTAYRQTNNGLSHRSRQEHKNAVKEITKKYFDEMDIWQKIKVLYYRTEWMITRRVYKLISVSSKIMRGKE